MSFYNLQTHIWKFPMQFDHILFVQLNSWEATALYIIWNNQTALITLLTPLFLFIKDLFHILLFFPNLWCHLQKVTQFGKVIGLSGCHHPHFFTTRPIEWSSKNHHITDARLLLIELKLPVPKTNKEQTSLLELYVETTFAKIR